MLLNNRLIKLILLCASALVFIACSEQSGSTIKPDPVAFESADECHVCGMAITRFPGPKAQTVDKRSPEPKKFCSTMDLLGWYLQPENKPNVIVAYVHDMSKAPWDAPDDQRMIEAEKAIFVIGSDLKGSMGPTLATFSTIADAENFISKHGGKAFKFNDITLASLHQHAM